jgi:opacity protein-like surface antigen
MKKSITLFVGMLILVLSSQIEAQSKWSFDLKSGVSYATEDLGDADLGVGIGFDGTFAYRILPHLSAYAGWGWNQFNAEESFAGKDIDFEETGYSLGFKFIHPFGESNISYLVHAGAVYNHIEVENNDGDIISDSGHGLGWQIGAGLSFPISGQLFINPTVSYRSLSRDIEIANVKTGVDQNYITAGVGLSWAF